jgi:uncharacterized membrane protein
MEKQRIACIGVLFTTALFCGAVIFPPAWIHFGHGPDFFTRGVYFFFSGVCHQMPDRSFHLWGKPLAVCSRCSGAYAGFLAGSLAFPLIRNGRRVGFPSPWIFGAALLPALVDFGLAHFGIFDSGGFIRASTGLIPGAAASFYILPGIFEIISGQSKSKGLKCKTSPAS